MDQQEAISEPAEAAAGRRRGRSKIAHQSWLTTDADEIELRRQRAASEPMIVRRLGDGKSVFANYEVWRTDSDEARHYTVELRSFDRRENSCDCPDFRKNRLGTCKHVEKVAAAMVSDKEAESPLVEIFLEHHPNGEVVPRVNVPRRCPPSVREFMSRYLGVADRLKRPVPTTLSVLLRNLRYASAKVQAGIRVSSVVQAYVVDCLHAEKMASLRATYAEQLRKDAGRAAFLRHPLYDYQIDGMLHLAFTGRAMLADEMGLGKTVQAIAAAHVLHDLHNLRRTLVVAPASLKTEWEDQIRKFTDLPCELVFGGRGERLRLYRDSQAFFVLANYEQIIRDGEEINDILRPDLIILDEAQRIKNWKTKTARRIKDLRSRFAFVLTGTPLENRIDELYSLVDFIDPTLFGSLFQFNRRFYNFDAEGRTAGFRNLAELHTTVSKVMLRRRKDDIAEQLPERIDNNYFVTMTAEQKKRYADHEAPATRLMAAAQRRPLSPAEMDSLQLHLSCMRMLCDTVYILDRQIDQSPKIDELLRILGDLWETEPERKVIVFSEWVRMLDLARAAFDAGQIAYALHTGEVPQQRRREQINRFKNDPACRVFLSSDSGGVGLNLQDASVVVNLDLPWNPAKLEQRIARAWRKHQKNTVNVINLIAEGTIEHRMLGTLAFKKGLAEAVLDARGDIAAVEQPSERSQFMERLATLMQTSFPEAGPEASAPPAAEEAANLPPAPPPTPPLERLGDDLGVTASPALQYFGAVDSGAPMPKALFAVADDLPAVRQELAQAVDRAFAGAAKPELLIVDPQTRALLEQLAQAGIITINAASLRPLVDRLGAEAPAPSDHRRRRSLAEPLLADARRQLKMATVLDANGFAAEAVGPLQQAGKLAGQALLVLASQPAPTAAPANLSRGDLETICALPKLPAEVALALHGCLGEADPGGNPRLLAGLQQAVDEAAHRLLHLPA